MKMAIKGGQLIHGFNIRYQQIKEWGTMKYSRADKTMTGPASYENLLMLKEMVGRLPGPYEEYFEKLKLQHDAIEEQRSAENPVPLVDYPVKVNLYKHQLRGANLAMLTFGTVPKDEGGDEDAERTR